MTALGAPPDVISRFRAAQTEAARQRGVDIFPENWHALNVFLAMASQWRAVAGFSGMRYLGLDYGALQPVLAEHRGFQHHQPMSRLMPQLRALEAAALPLRNGD